mmetsp:Transcript_42429/g.96435  ORF Transcript_42429/g.96435 Transcript_42429/m.96435 type:complete len:95 (+) Transcript_42429:1-285(+)
MNASPTGSEPQLKVAASPQPWEDFSYAASPPTALKPEGEVTPKRAAAFTPFPPVIERPVYAMKEEDVPPPWAGNRTPSESSQTSGLEYSIRVEA